MLVKLVWGHFDTCRMRSVRLKLASVSQHLTHMHRRRISTKYFCPNMQLGQWLTTAIANQNGVQKKKQVQGPSLIYTYNTIYIIYINIYIYIPFGFWAFWTNRWVPAKRHRRWRFAVWIVAEVDAVAVDAWCTWKTPQDSGIKSPKMLVMWI